MTRNRVQICEFPPSGRCWPVVLRKKEGSPQRRRGFWKNLLATEGGHKKFEYLSPCFFPEFFGCLASLQFRVASVSAAPVIQQVLELLEDVPALMFSPLELEALVPQFRLGKHLWQSCPGEEGFEKISQPVKKPHQFRDHQQTHTGLRRTFGSWKSLPMSCIGSFYGLCGPTCGGWRHASAPKKWLCNGYLLNIPVSCMSWILHLPKTAKYLPKHS